MAWRILILVVLLARRNLPFAGLNLKPCIKMSMIPMKTPVKGNQKYTPYTKLSRQELIDIACKSSQRLKIFNQKVKKLKEYRDKMQSVSESTDKDLRKMFDKLHKSIIEKREKLENCYCKWSDCDVNLKPDDCEDLLIHIKTHIPTKSSTAPVSNVCKCHWADCSKEFSKIN